MQTQKLQLYIYINTHTHKEKQLFGGLDEIYSVFFLIFFIPCSKLALFFAKSLKRIQPSDRHIFRVLARHLNLILCG